MRDDDPQQQLARAIETIAELQQELAETNQSLTALSVEFEDKVRRVRLAETKFQKLFEAAPDAIVVVDSEGKIVLINTRTEAMFGYARRDLLGRPVEILVPERLRQAHATHRRTYLDAPRVRSMGLGLDLIGLRKDGSEFPVDIGLSPLDTEDGWLVISIIRDTTEHHEMEKALRRAEIRHRSIIRHALYGIFHSTDEGHFTEVNPALVEMLGYDSEEELLKTYMPTDLYVNPADRERLLDQLRSMTRIHGVEVEWKKKDGTPITVRLSGRIVRNEPGIPDGFEIIVEDVTAHRILEEQMRQAQKMEAVGQMAGGIAHDFNNLLTVILGYSEIGLMDRSNSFHEALTEIKRAGEQASVLTRQLLAFSRKQILQPRVLALNSLIKDFNKLIQRMLEENISLVMELDPALGRVKADPGQLEQVLMNLCVNARDAMPQGGTLTIETLNAELTGDFVHTHPGDQPGAYVALRVRDTGTGMDATVRSHIFEPFFTTKDPGKGTGLGLATVYGIVKQSEGYIDVDSTPGHGTTFTLYLPRTEEPEEAPGVSTAPPPRTSGSETILLIEDEDGIRQFVSRVLQQAGYTILEAADGEEALSLCRRHAGHVHLVVTDVVMPRMSGPECVEHLMMIYPAIKILYMSGHADETLGHHGIPSRATPVALLQKPFTPATLLQKVREVLDIASA